MDERGDDVGIGVALRRRGVHMAALVNELVLAFQALEYLPLPGSISKMAIFIGPPLRPAGL
jgi:hypothetical protein